MLRVAIIAPITSPQAAAFRTVQPPRLFRTHKYASSVTKNAAMPSVMNTYEYRVSWSCCSSTYAQSGAASSPANCAASAAARVTAPAMNPALRTRQAAKSRSLAAYRTDNTIGSAGGL